MKEVRDPRVSNQKIFYQVDANLLNIYLEEFYTLYV